MGENKGIINNKYYKQVSELTKLYESIKKMYNKLAKLEKNGQKDSKEYNEFVNLIKCALEIERKKYLVFDNLDSVEMEDMIYEICTLKDQYEEELVDKTRLYETDKIKRLLTRLRDYSFLRNDTYDYNEEAKDENRTFQFPTTSGMYLQATAADLKRLGFTYNEPEEKKEEDEEELEHIKTVNTAMYYREKLINANFYKLLEEEIEKTQTKKYKNELIDYKYNLIYNCVSLENDFAEKRDISSRVNLYKYIVDEFEEMNPDEYENVYSDVIEQDIKDRIQELKSKEYEEELPNKEEAFEDKIDLLYIKALINSLISSKSRNHIIEYTNAASNETDEQSKIAYLNIINNTVKELKLK